MGELDLMAACATLLLQLEAFPAEKRAIEAHRLYSQILDLQSRVANARRSGVREMRAEGMTLAEVAVVLGVGSTRVKQIEDGIRRQPKPA
jgi:DNA-directed RNA polymerase sigma subunit (sigma70/sigma32)